MSEHLILAGASVRAAAFSAKRAGFSPLAVDLFADADLRECCPAVQVQEYPTGIVQCVRTLPHAGWMYTGGLENAADVVDAISDERPLFGNAGDVLRRMRNPFALQASLAGAGLRFPETVRCADAVPGNGRWLCKTRRSAAGSGVWWWHKETVRRAVKGGNYWQRHISGDSFAAAYVAAGGRAVLLGLSRQLVGTRWSHAREFQYSGSIGPLHTGGKIRPQLDRLGHVLSQEFQLRGLFGVDLILDGSQRVWPVEVNPRYAASLEVLEHGLENSAVGIHVAACRDGQLPEIRQERSLPLVGKSILFARADLQITEERSLQLVSQPAGHYGPSLADLPCPDTQIRRGDPILTVFAEGNSECEVECLLQERTLAMEKMLFE